MSIADLNWQPIVRWPQEQPDGPNLLHWAVSYLAQPHPHLGRSGAVCPFVPAALRRGRIEFAVVPETVTTVVQVVSTAHQAVDRVADDAGHGDIEVAALLVFRHFNSPQHHATLLEAHRAARPDMIDNGMMIGEFFPGYSLPGLRDAAFRAGDSPLPLLVVRNMVHRDRDFLAREPGGLPGPYLRRFARPESSG